MNFVMTILSKFSLKLELFFACLILLLSSNAVHSKVIDDNEILKNIEKSLLFDNDDQQNINFYRQNQDKESEIVINRGGQNASDIKDGAPRVDVVVVNVDQDSDKIKEKLYLAYNASLVNQNEVAIQLYKEVLYLAPNSHYAKFSLAVLYQKMNQFLQAKKLYQELLDDNPENKHEIIGNLLSIMIEESPREAIYFLSRLSRQKPNSPYILAKLALAYESMGEYNQAISYLKDASMNEGNNIEYIYNMAIIYDKMNEKESAIRSYQNVIKNYSNSYDFIPINSVKSRVSFLKSYN